MITIIVLLILAGVTVATLTGENGLLNKAATAREKNKEAEQDEKDKLSSYEDGISNYKTWERTGEDSTDDTVTISQDEYNMLKNANTYLESKQIVGKWFDGRPVYRYWYRFTKTTSGEVEVTFQSMGLTDYPYFDKIIKSESRVISSPNNFAASEYSFASGDYYGHYIKADRQSVIFRSGQSWPKLPAEMIFMIDYTKTTDTVPQQ